MARHEAEREDLMREATALVRRIELRFPDADETTVVGFRRDGSASFFFGADPVYQFNSDRQIRRAFRSGILYKAERGRLVSLTRRRGEAQVELVSRDVLPTDCESFLSEMRERMQALRLAMAADGLAIVGQVPQNDELADSICAWLDRLLESPVQIAATPRAGSGR